MLNLLLMRRALLGFLVLLTVTAGCVSTGTQTTSSTPEPLTDVPKPADECRVSTLPNATYPPLPRVISESSAENFSLEFEKAYSSGALEAHDGVTFNGFDGWGTEVTHQTNSGYVVRTTVHLDFVEESGQTTVAGSESSYGWYYVTEEFAVRAPGSYSDSLPTSGWETIACA